MTLVRNEYPRPQFRRDDWQGLNGEWEFAFDDQKIGVKKAYYGGKVAFDKKINVPFTYQYPASGIGESAQHDVLWYKRAFTVDKQNAGKRALLCFNGVDYDCTVWVNGKFAAKHVGGFAPFHADITDLLNGKENVIVVRCEDTLADWVPRGKQSWLGKNFSCFYLPNSGIWQSVWIEYFGADAIDNYSLLSDFDNNAFYGEIHTMYGLATAVEIVATYKGVELKRERISLDGAQTNYQVKLAQPFQENYGWTPQNPNLITVDFTLYQGNKVVDVAHTRFGMRKIAVDDYGTVTLNNRKLYQKLILDQGYWEESGLTPPSAESVKKDIELAMAMGFNGARKHQKFEDPYFYYYAEELGFLTWCEMPSAYRYCEKEIQAVTGEWLQILQTAKNFTSVVCYVPLNESWGVREIANDFRQQQFAQGLYYLTKGVDNTRLISTNDGFENVNPTDILGVHDYEERKADVIEEKYEDGYDHLYPQGWPLFATGHGHEGQPVLLTEFGGIALQGLKGDAWGYNEAATDGEDLLDKLKEIFKGIKRTEFQGFCYTQLTDVQQEVNGLLTVDRTPKLASEKLKAILDKIK